MWFHGTNKKEQQIYLLHPSSHQRSRFQLTKQAIFQKWTNSVDTLQQELEAHELTLVQIKEKVILLEFNWSVKNQSWTPWINLISWFYGPDSPTRSSAEFSRNRPNCGLLWSGPSSAFSANLRFPKKKSQIKVYPPFKTSCAKDSGHSKSVDIRVDSLISWRSIWNHENNCEWNQTYGS